MLPFKYLVDFKGATLPLLLSKCGMMVCHKVSPFASAAALSLDHAPEMKGHLGHIWSRAVVTWISSSYALLDVKLHPICSWLFCTLERRERSGAETPCLHTCSQCDLTPLYHHTSYIMFSLIHKEMVMEWDASLLSYFSYK